MKFLKSQTLSRYSPSDNALQINSYGRAVMDINGALMIPKGTTAERPDITGVRQPAEGETLSSRIPNGYIRFNTDTDSFEGYINGAWEIIKGSGAAAISKSQHGPGDGSDTIYGPLLPAFAGTYSSSDDNIIVLVENVWQISTTNYTVELNPFNSTSPVDLLAGNFVISTEYIIVTTGNTDFTLLGAADSNPGTIFTATGTGNLGETGVARPTGYYLEFTSAIPATGDGGNPVYVTVYYGYAK